MPKKQQKDVNEEDLEDRPADAEVFQIVQNFGRYWKILGRDLGVSNETLEIIENDRWGSGMTEMTYQMLLAWQREKTSEATVKTLAHHLANRERKDLAQKILRVCLRTKGKQSRHSNLEEVEKIIESLNNASANPITKRPLREKVRSELTSRYKKLVLKGLPWMDEVNIPLDRYYVELSLTQQHGSSRSKSVSDIKFEEIFSEERPKGIRILVEGAPGYGKTTFASKLCSDYAQNQFYMQRFSLVLFLPLRHFTGDWRQSLCKSAGINENESNTLLAVLNTKDKSILIILDGYDELSDENKQLVLPIIRGQLFPRLNVVVTSRPGMFSTHEHNKDYPHDIADPVLWNKQLQLAGFREDKQEEFIQTHLQNYHDEKKNQVMEKLQQMKEKKFIETGFLECPLFLLITILVLTKQERAEQHFQTKTELYKKICNLIIRRYADKKGYKSEVDLFAVTKNSDYIKLMTEFSKFALKALQKGHLLFSREYILSELQADENTTTQIIEMGFLVTNVIEEGIWTEVFYEPVHKSLMEFAAAYGLWIMASDGTSASQWQEQVAFIRPQKASGDSLIFPFLVGLMKESADTLFQAIEPHADDYSCDFGLLCSSLSEVHPTPSVFTSLLPYLPGDWDFKWCTGHNNLASSGKFKEILHHGIKNGKIKEMRCNLEHAAWLPDDVHVEKLTIETLEPVPPLPVVQCTNFSCTELCIQMNYTYHKSSDVWLKFLAHLCSISYMKVSFTVKDCLPFFLPMIKSALTGNRLKNCHVQRIECCVEENSSLVDLVELVNVADVEVIELQLKINPTTISKSCHKQRAEWQQRLDSLLQCIAQKATLTKFTLKNKTTYNLTIHWDKLWQDNRLWKMIWLEGVIVVSYSKELHELNNQHLLPLYQKSTSHNEIRCSAFITAESLVDCVKLLSNFSHDQQQTISLRLFFPYPFIFPSNSSDVEQTQLTENQTQFMGTLIKLIENETVSALEIHIDHIHIHDVKDQNLDLLSQFEAIFTSSASSTNLTKFVFKNSTEHKLSVNLDTLCDSNKKIWSMLCLEGVNIQCTHSIRETLENQTPTVLCQYIRKDSLEQWCYFVATDETLEEWLLMLSRICSAQYQDVSFIFFGYPYFLPYIKCYLTHIHKIEFHLKERQCHMLDAVLPLIKRNKLEILELHLHSPPLPITSPTELCNDECSVKGCDFMSQKQIDILLSFAAKAENLLEFVFKNKTSFYYVINLEEMCATDQKLWKTVLLEGVKVKTMESEMDKRIEIKECTYTDDITSSSLVCDTLIRSLRFCLLPKLQNSEVIHVQKREHELLPENALTFLDNEQLNNQIDSIYDQLNSGSNQVTNDVESPTSNYDATSSQNSEPANSVHGQIEFSSAQVNIGAESPTLNQEHTSENDLLTASIYQQFNSDSSQASSGAESPTLNQESTLENDQKTASVQNIFNSGSDQVPNAVESPTPNEESTSLNDQHAASVGQQIDSGSNHVNNGAESSITQPESAVSTQMQLNNQQEPVHQLNKYGSIQVNSSEDNQYQSSQSIPRSRSLNRSRRAARNAKQLRSTSSSPTPNTPLLPNESSNEDDDCCCKCCCVS